MVLEAQQIERVESENGAGPVKAKERMAVRRDELIDRLREVMEATAFSNRFLLSPRRLPQIAQAEADAFLDFLKTGDADRIREQGVKRAEEGLGERAMLRLGTTLRQFCRDKLADEALRAADVYTNALLEGFMEGREAIVLREQEQIRVALQRVASKRALQLATAAEVSRAASSILDTDELLTEIVYLICDRFNLYYVGIFLVDETSEYVVLRAGTGEAGLQMLKAGHKFKIGGTSMVGWCAANAQARIALDVGQEAVRFDNPLLPETRSEMALPLISRGQVIGVMTIQSTQPNAFSGEDIAVLQTMADQLANAIHNARLYEAEQKQVVQLAVVNQVARRAASILDMGQLLQGVVTAIQQSFNYHNVALSLLDETVGELEVRAIVGGFADAVPPGYRQAVGKGITGWVAQTGQSLLANDVSQEPRYIPGFLEEPLTKSELCVPLKLVGQVIGVLDAQDIQLNAFDEADLMAMETLADQIAVAIENARLFEETQRRADQMAALGQMNMALTSTLELDQILEMVLDQLKTILDYDSASIQTLLGPSTVRVAAARPPGHDEGLRKGFDASQNPLFYEMKEGRQAVVIDDVHLDDRWIKIGDWEHVRSWVGVPLFAKDNFLGFLNAEKGIPGFYKEADVQLLRDFAQGAALAIENARLFEAEAQRRREAETLRQAAAALTSTLDLEKALDLILEQLHRVVAYDSASIHLLQDDHLEIVGGRGFADPSAIIGLRFPVPGDNPNTHVIERGEPVILADAQAAHAPFREPPHDHIRSWLGVPMRFRERTIGMIALDSTESGHFTADHARLATAFASQAAVAVENARLFQETQIHARELAVLNEMGRALTTMLDVDAVIESLYQHASRLIDTTNFYVALYYPEQDEVSFPLYAEEEQIRQPERRRSGKGLTEYVIRTREPLLVEENLIERLEELGIETIGQEAQSWLGVPMISGEQVIGVIAVQSYTTPRLYNERHRDLLSAIANQAAIAIENARLFEQAQARARREQILREITARVRGSTDPDAIVRTAVRELGTALGRSTFVRLGNAEKPSPTSATQVDSGDGQGTAQQGQHPEFVEGGE